MASEIFEFRHCVIEATLTPDTPGRCRRLLTVEILSGPPLELEPDEVEALIAEVRAIVERDGSILRRAWIGGLTDADDR